MVPCQPRQLVIFSLPFAALVAFFWFKRRRSQSRSDPGGTTARQKPGDITAVNGKLTIENPSTSQTGAVEAVEKTFDKSLVKSEEAVKKIACESPAVEEVFFEKSVLSVQCTSENSENNIVDLLKSAEVVEEKGLICNGSATPIKEVTEKELENYPFTPVSENNRIFHSTVIESETDLEETKDNISLLDINQKVEEETSCNNKREQHNCNKELGSAENTGLNSGAEKSNRLEEGVEKSHNKIKVEENLELSRSVPLEKQSTVEYNTSNKRAVVNKKKNRNKKKIEEKFEQSRSIPLEDQSTVEYNPSNKRTVVNKTTVEFSSDDTKVSTDFNNCASSSNTDTSEKIENVSTDTGLGSQDPSAAEDCNVSMAQGQKTDEKNENATGLEQKLASLGLDTSQQPVQRTERDSANHSPAEVMLNSPAISTFSDAHSEGSSDSGKGCSDVVTPPSRTPAGGSSVAGDLAPSIYEFVLPQVIVGRLIGRHGAFLHDIRAKTHTNVFIKKHPETNNLKICAIEGTQQDIDAALKMIRQKFPLRRFPDLTLEKVSFVKNPCLPINPEQLRLHLVEGVNNDVIVSSVITAGHFFLQMPTHMSYQCLYKLACIMNSVYNTQESPPLVEPQPDVVCVAPTHGGWYRAQIMNVDEETNTSEIKFLDYGGFVTVDNACLRQIRGDFLLLPFQAVECVLANVTPAGGEESWSEEAREFVQMMTSNQTLQAQVYEYTETGLPLVYLYCTQFYQSVTDPNGYETKVVLLNQELVSRGYADLIDSSQEDQTTVTESS